MSTAVVALRRLIDDRRVRYLLTGGVASIVYYGVFSGGWVLSGHRIPYLAMAVIANLVCAVTTYPLYRIGVFRTGGPWLREFGKFYLICFWSLLFSLIGLPLLVELAGLPVLVAQALLVVSAPLINYQLNRIWAFRT